MCALDNHTPEEYNMTTGTKRMVALFVERSYQQWVVRDPRVTSGYCLPWKTLGAAPTVLPDARDGAGAGP